MDATFFQVEGKPKQVTQQHFSGCAMNLLAAMPPLTMLDAAEAVA